MPPISGIEEQDYVSLGALKQLSGTQRYAIPDNIDLKEFQSAEAWCRQFNATFGYATLGSGGQMGGPVENNGGSMNNPGTGR